MKGLLITTLAFLMSACATRTLYKPHGQSGGYSEAPVKDNIYMARFTGNAYTHTNDAQVFAQFRAVEICHEQGFKVAKILGVDNKTTSQTVQKSSSYNYQQPTYFSGTANTNTNYNYYGGNTLNANSNTNVNGTVYGGNAYGGTTTWNETYNYPTFDAYFSCHNDIHLAGVELKNLTADDIKEFTKDKLGGLQVIKVSDESPNQDIFQIGDILLKVNNLRVLEVQQMSKAIDSAKNKSTISANIVREGKPMVIRFKAKDFTEMFKQMNMEIVRNACSVQEVKSRPICSGRSISSQR
jgi:hypothetical protein